MPDVIDPRPSNPLGILDDDPPIGPRVDRCKLRGRTVEVRGPALAWLVSGEARVRGGAEASTTLVAGDLLTLGLAGEARLGGPQAEAELLVFRASETWARGALRFSGRRTHAETPALFVERAGSDAARRGGRVLRELAGRPAHDAGDDASLDTAARHLELLALALAPRDGLATPAARENRRARARRERFLRIVGGLEDEPLDGIGLTTIALRLGASERQTSRLFRSELSTTFREFLSRLRLERAKKLLRETDRAIIDVAAETGWRSLGHFTTTFRRRVGTTPSAYRAEATDPPSRGAGHRDRAA
jgi:AraC-like DNA-binding protein